jgi:hypothetical protein
MRRTAIAAGMATAAFALAALEWPGARSRLAGGWLGVLGALALLRLAGRLRTAYPLPARAPWRPPRWVRRWAGAVGQVRDRWRRGARNRPVTADLGRMEGVVAESLSTASGVHRRLRPVVRDIVEDRLAMRAGLRLDRDARRVRDLVGEEVWALIRPGQTFPEDGFAPGLRPAELGALLDRLESLGLQS